MKKLFLALALVAMVFATGCHKENNGGDDNGGGNGGNNGGGGDTPSKTYTVTFNANGGTGEMPSMIFTQGVSQTLPDNTFTFGDREFLGWNTKANGTGVAYSDKQTIVVTKSMTLYAQWEKYLYTVTFNANGGIGTMQPQTFTEGEANALKANAFIRTKYAFAGWNTDPNGTGSAYADMQEITVSQNMSLYAQWQQRVVPEGAINAPFSVSGTTQVYFSQGNLQYQASTGTWRFATSQLEYIGSNNANISSSYSGWIDLFGWGTGNNPTNSSTSTSNYSSFTDWGTKPISNGGNQANQWRTLTYDEWNFLMFNRTTISGRRFARATVNGVKGVIILPDDWNTSYYTLSSTNSTGAAFTANTITSANWTSKLEARGAVFLPAAGDRSGTSLYVVGSFGYYWSSSPDISYFAFCLAFNGSGLDVGPNFRYYGQSVRLVSVAE